MLRLEPEEAHVWEAALDGGEASRGAGLLSSDERERAARFVYDVHRERFTSRRAILRRLLAAYIGTAPQRIELHYGPNGKPYLPGGELELNLSHSADRALLAFARRPIGVDLEKLRPVEDALEIATRFFSPPETAELAQLEAEERSGRFLDLWTKKEAFVKALGVGLSRPLPSFTVPRGEEGWVEPAEQDKAWRLCRLRVHDGFAGAFAAEGEDLRIVQRQWPAEFD
ncbi:MAG: 4'-phosphopantetheinyl transferase superfamily protein [Bryobacterales bacterium]|nr:4'-phosphopantetheinyl transferase superfamily protein [Acidobacteriota bacterium]MCB9385981.1 4'-phosphopantetheinyl transferase superfamily protein [Bryobacterales bacterium]